MKKWIYRIALLICIGVFGYSAYNLYLIYSTKAEVDGEVETIKKEVFVEKEPDDNGTTAFEVDWDALKAKNADIVAWLYVPDCKISYPVVQGEDNGYYLDHTVTHEWNELGSIFLDYENEPDFSSLNNLVYGHSVEGTGGMFTDLNKYENPDFFKNHPTVYLLTPSVNYKGNVLCFAKTEDGTHYYDIYAENKDEFINTLKMGAMYSNDINTDGNLLTLSTCNLDYGLYSLQRYVLVSVLEATEEPIEVK